MKEIHFSPTCIKQLKKIKKRQTSLFHQAEKQLILFSKNPNHPSLRTHKLQGKLKNVWSISIGMDIRAVYIEDDTSYYFFEIGTHDELYR